MENSKGDRIELSSKDNILRELYYNLESPSAYSSYRVLTRAAKHFDSSINQSYTKNWLSKQNVYVTHRRKIKKFPRRKIITSGIDDLHQMDLMDVSNIARFNGGVRFLLVSIDCFSRFVFCRPVKRKLGEHVAKALDSIYQTEGRIPENCQFDQGTEFLNVHVRTVLKQYNVHWYWVNSPLKSALIERFIRSFRSIMGKALYNRPTPRYLDILPDLLAIYNRRIHRSLGIAPISVNKSNERYLWDKQYKNQFPKTVNFTFSIGDSVKIVRKKKFFEKEWTPSWTKETYFIVFRQNTKPATYKLQDHAGNIIPRIFYAPELQLIGGEQ